jgi:hypothetical protein
MAWFRTELLNGAAAGSMGVLPLIAGVCVVTSLGFTAWARALFEAGQSHGPLGEGRLPGMLGDPKVVAALGFLLPGFGLLLTGHPRRAAWAMWALGPGVAAALILGHAPRLWEINQGQSAGNIPGLALEIVLLAALALVLAGAAIWLVQALDGARCAWRRTEPAVSGGGWVGLALLVAIAVVLIVFKPARVAQDLDRLASAMRLDGLQIIPLCMELAAIRLDPAIPLYTVRAAELYDQLDEPATARRLRDELRARWNACAATLQQPEP